MRFARLALGFGIVLALGMVLGGLLTANALNQAPPAIEPVAAAPKEGAQEISLKTRKDNGAYGESAYSFRQASSDVAVHNNYVDLLLNGCGQLHVCPVTGSEGRIVDLGKARLADAPDAPPAGAHWKTESLRPAAGHVYLLEISESGQTMTVKFAAEAVSADGVKLAWTIVTPVAGAAPHPNRGRAGTMGQCGGEHESR